MLSGTFAGAVCALALAAEPPVEARRPTTVVRLAPEGCRVRIREQGIEGDRKKLEIRVDGRPGFHSLMHVEQNGPSGAVKWLRFAYYGGQHQNDARISFDLPQHETQPVTAVTFTLLDGMGATLWKQQKTVADGRAEIRGANESGRPSPSIPALRNVELVARFRFPAEVFPKVRTAVIGLSRRATVRWPVARDEPAAEAASAINRIHWSAKAAGPAP